MDVEIIDSLNIGRCPDRSLDPHHYYPSGECKHFDIASSASRQYFIDTGRYLLVGEVPEEVIPPMRVDGATVLVVGDPVEGITLIGPFDGWQAATDYAPKFHKHESWTIATLYQPEKEN